jgi:exodeoxyribonuclease V gamma subunit
VLQRHTAPGVEPLVEVLARVLAEPLADPMAPELVLAPTQGMLQWLRERLARTLGATGAAGRGDGVVANIDLGFPGLVRQRVLAADRAPGQPDPWAVDHLVWTVLGVLRDEGAADAALAPVTELPEGATWFGRARRLADLLDRYELRRPDMVRAWAAGRDVDGEDRPLAEHQRWQPRLWRLVRARVGLASPAERLPGLVDALAAGALHPELPPRFALFGLTSTPAGLGLDLLEALAVHHDLQLLVVEPSPGMARRTRAALAATPVAPTTSRAEDPTAEAARHPLLASWARPARECTVLLAPRDLDATDTAEDGPPPRHLLGRLQADLREGGRPRGTHRPDPRDRSIQVHACHGELRQVEVLRDALLHLLAADPTLREDDVVVLCPDLERYAPLVEAVFGTPADEAPRTSPPEGAAVRRLLAYRLADRSLRDTYPTMAALEVLVGLLGGRFTASSVLDLIRQAPVRRRYAFGDDDLDAIVGWATEADVRWGLDGAQREAVAGLPADHGALTWQAALDRLLAGVAASDDELALVAGAVVPLDVEGGRVAVAGRLGDLVARLGALDREAATPRPAAAWCELLAAAADDLFEAPPDAPWQRTRLLATLQEIAGAAVAGRGDEVDLTLDDLRRLLRDHLDGPPRHPAFFRGGITVSSLTPLRGVPHRVVAVLGLDEGALAGPGTDGDDLVGAAPRLGDPDPRAEGRQALLEAVLSAGDNLVITRTGASVVTNQPVPPCTPLAELTDAVRAAVHRDDHEQLARTLETAHPRQGYDERNYRPGAVVAGDEPWSFDPAGLAGARARTAVRRPPAPFLAAPLEAPPTDVVDLADLHATLKNPTGTFLRRSLRVHVPRSSDPGTEDLPTRLGGLDGWQVGTRLLELLLAGGTEDDWAARERALGSLPAGALGREDVESFTTSVGALVREVGALGLGGRAPGARPVDVTLTGGARLVGVVQDHGGHRPGPMRVSYSRHKPEHRLAAWLDLVALTVADPVTPWWSVTVNRTSKVTEPVGIEVLVLDGAGPEEREATARRCLAVALDCHRRSLVAPFPLFPSLSPTLVRPEGTGPRGRWRAAPKAPPADGDDAGVRLVYGDLGYDDLLALPPLDGDPPGDAGSRVQRCADHLWGTLYDSLTITAGPDAATVLTQPTGDGAEVAS